MNRVLTNQKLTFQKMYTFNQRYVEALRVLNKYPDRIPIICEKDEKCSSIGDLNKEKYLVDKTLTCAQFMFIIRKQLVLPAEKAIFLFINDILPNNNNTLAELYENHKSNDGFLYIKYNSENVFG
jgi:GABA(A) receptor-associated protein